MSGYRCSACNKTIPVSVAANYVSGYDLGLKHWDAEAAVELIYCDKCYRLYTREGETYEKETNKKESSS